MEKIRFGLIGYGKVAHLHAKALCEAENARLVGVCGRNAEKRANFAAQYGVRASADVREMAKKGADAVIITVPHPQHCECALEAFDAGCHVLIEKPMALNTAECECIIAAAQKKNKIVGVISQRRLYPACRRIRDAIRGGKLGIPALGQVIMLGWRDKAYYDSDPWRGKWESEGGGVLVNQAPHQLDLLQWFMGPAEEIRGFWGNVNHPYIEVEDTAVAAIKFKNGGFGSVLVSNSQKPGIYAKVHIHGSNAYSAGVQTDGGAMFIAGMSGILEPPVNDLWTVPEEISLLEAWKEADTAFFKTIDPTWYFFKLQAEDFARAITEGNNPLVTGEDGLETVRLIEGIYASGRQTERKQ